MSEPAIVVSEVAVRLARDQEHGPYAWASCVVNGSILLTNTAIIRDSDGGFRTRFPVKKSLTGREHYYHCPITREAKKTIDDAVLAFCRK